jgi:hypothetical protein
MELVQIGQVWVPKTVTYRDASYHWAYQLEWKEVNPAPEKLDFDFGRFAVVINDLLPSKKDNP